MQTAFLYAATVLIWGSSWLAIKLQLGADRAAYTTLIFPGVALLVSSLFEDYRWTLWSAAGLGLVVTGNWLAMRGARNRAAQ